MIEEIRVLQIVLLVIANGTVRLLSLRPVQKRTVRRLLHSLTLVRRDPSQGRGPHADPEETHSEPENAYMPVAIRAWIADLRAEFRTVSDQR